MHRGRLANLTCRVGVVRVGLGLGPQGQPCQSDLQGRGGEGRARAQGQHYQSDL